MAKIGACGDNCDFCHRYKATTSGKIEELEKVKELWVRIGLRNYSFPARELSCTGCRPNAYCGSKELLECVRAKGIENCGICSSYPCEAILKAINKSEKWKLEIKSKCNKEEYEMITKAFCRKKENLDKINSEIRKKHGSQRIY
jgi:hypothetical protein